MQAKSAKSKRRLKNSVDPFLRNRKSEKLTFEQGYYSLNKCVVLETNQLINIALTQQRRLYSARFFLLETGLCFY